MQSWWGSELAPISHRAKAVPELSRSDPSSVMLSLPVNQELDSLTCRLFAGDREPHAVDRLLRSRRSRNTPTSLPNPATEEQAVRYWVTVSLARYHQSSLSSPGIVKYRTPRQLPQRPLASIAFTPTCSCSDTRCREVMLGGNWNDSLERPCGCWSWSLHHAHPAQALDGP